jgi:ATP-dependent DNA helicase RecG
MAIMTAFIDIAQWELITSTNEGHFFDIKSIDISPAKLTKALSAFANADGGELYVGVDEDKIENVRYWRGFNSEESANGHLQIFEELFPLGNDFQYEFISMNGMTGFLLHVNVLKTQDIKRASDNIPYIRRGAASLPVNTNEKLKRLEFEKGISSFENERVSDADSELITESSATDMLTSYIVPNSQPSDWLRKQRLILGM